VKTAARLAAEALETGLALTIDLAAVERLALLVVADDFVSRVQFGKTRRRLGVVLVGVGMQLLGELAEGGLDLRLARALGHPQNGVGVTHPWQLPSIR